jgi:hypothetical protein
MKKALKLLGTFLFVSFTLITNAQVGINSDGSSPDASAMLDIKSTTKGILIPRMTTAERTAIGTPATGLMVFDIDEAAFWYYNGAAWSAIGGSSAFTSENGITHSNNNSDDFVFGTDNLDYSSGTEYKLFFDKSKGAFRAGAITGTKWDESNIGNFSIGFGSDTKASGAISASFGSGTTANGSISTSFGSGTTASGSISTSFGINTTAIGNSSTSFGNSTTASETASTSFGFFTVASGAASTSFGNSTTASGTASTSFGAFTSAYSYAEIALGSYNTVYTPDNATGFDSDDRVFVIGNGTSVAARSDAMVVYKNGNTQINGDLTISGSFTNGNTAFLSENGITHSNNNNDDFVFGVDSLNYGSGTEYKLFFDKSKGAFRAGTVAGTYWDESNRGDYSIGLGYNTKASGNYSTSFGSSTTASGSYSTSFGSSTAASGSYATSFGRNTTAYSYGETALGSYNTVYTPNNITGFDSDDRLFVIGNGTTSARSDAMIVYKNGNTQINGDLTISGHLILTDTIGFSSKNGITYSNNNSDDFVFGADSLNWGGGFESKMFFDKDKGAFRAGTAVGTHWDEDNIGNTSTSFGFFTTASGDVSTSFGAGTIASGEHSTSFGTGTTASAKSSASFGFETTASGELSTSFGYKTTASGRNSISCGANSIASGDYSISLGTNTIAYSYAETVLGSYSTVYTPDDTLAFDIDDRAFVIGNGTSTSARSDAMIVYKNGSVWMQGDLTVNSTSYTSDIRLKENINTSKYGLNDILNIKVRDYQFKKDTTAHLHTGFLAQQLHTVFPHAVHIGGDDENINPWTVDYASLTPLLVKGTQEQQVIIDDLKLKQQQQQIIIEEQQQQIKTLQTQIQKVNQLEAKLNALLKNNNATVSTNAKK